MPPSQANAIMGNCCVVAFGSGWFKPQPECTLSQLRHFVIWPVLSLQAVNLAIVQFEGCSGINHLLSIARYGLHYVGRATITSTSLRIIFFFFMIGSSHGKKKSFLVIPTGAPGQRQQQLQQLRLSPMACHATRISIGFTPSSGLSLVARNPPGIYDGRPEFVPPKSSTHLLLAFNLNGTS